MPTPESLNDNERWLLSFYRESELTGALFFGRVARTVRGPLQADLTQHFADESAHTAYWTRCLADLDLRAARLGYAYQDQYLAMVGAPASLMEVMAITHVFEKRAIGMYRRHLRRPGVHPAITATIERIMRDERWHVSYVKAALEAMGRELGADNVAAALRRYAAADEEIYARTLVELGERLAFLDQGAVNAHEGENDDRD
jgi:hypothetical protein